MTVDKKALQTILIVFAAIVFIIYLVFYIFPGRDFVTRYKYRYNTAQTSAQSSSRPVKTGDGILEPVYAKGLPEGVHAAILPRLELLSGVLSQTSWGEKYGPPGKGNKYYNELKEHFSEYKEHKAVQKAEKLMDMGYSNLFYILLNFSEIPYLELPSEIPESSSLRSMKIDEIKEFGTALADLSEEMDFPGFFEAHRDEFQRYVDKSIRGHDSLKIINWLNNFYGEVYKKADYYTVFAPALFYASGFSVTIPDNDGSVTAYQVVMADRKSEEVKFRQGLALEFLTIHEWGHSYVNPALSANSELVAKYQIRKLHQPISGKMLSESYNNFGSFFNEQVLRGAVTIACREMYGEFFYWYNLIKHENSGFYLTDFTVKQLEYYQKNRDKYKNLSEFIPYLYEQYNKNMDSLLKQAP